MRAAWVLVGLVCVAGLAPLGITPVEEDRVRGTYIVVFRDGVNATSVESHMSMVSKVGKVRFEYKHTIKGYSASLNEEGLAMVRAEGIVKYVEEDQVARLAQSCTEQINAKPWGLDRVCHCSPTEPAGRTGHYIYPSTAGSGTTVYIIDTGIYCQHVEFGARCAFGINTVSGEGDFDCNGHGTHVAGTVAGSEYGLAKQAKVVAVKVLGCGGSGSYEGVIAGVDWVAGNHNEAETGVANLSLGGGPSSALDEALQKLKDDRVLPVVAAGNSNADACNSSPSRADGVMTVGSTAQAAAGGKDTRSSFSNYGTCLDTFAPGSSILSAYSTCTSTGSNCNPTAEATLSGTSMAAPHAAGVASLILAQESLTPMELERKIDDHAWDDLVQLNCPAGNAACLATCNSLISTSFSKCGDVPGGECSWPTEGSICYVDKSARKAKGREAATVKQTWM